MTLYECTWNVRSLRACPLASRLAEESLGGAGSGPVVCCRSSTLYGDHRPAMLFWPNCANLLIISAQTGYNKWACNTCAYEFPIAKQVVKCFCLLGCSFIPQSLR